jgi:hypothetical protein
MNDQLIYTGTWKIWTKKVFLLDPVIGIGAKILYLALLSFSNEEMKAFPSAATLGKGLGISPETVRRYAAELEEVGLIRRKQETKPGGQFSYTVYQLFKTSVLARRDGKIPCTEKPVTVKSATNEVPLEGTITKGKKREPEAAGAAVLSPNEQKRNDAVDQFFKMWNGIPGFRNCLNLDNSRKSKLRSRLNEPFFAANWTKAIQRAAKSDFLVGKNDRGWRANVEWFLRPVTVSRILEGEYDNAPSTQPHYQP